MKLKVSQSHVSAKEECLTLIKLLLEKCF